MSSTADWSFKSALFPKKHFNVWRWTFYGDARKLSITHSISSMWYIMGGSWMWSTDLMVCQFPQHSPGSPAAWEERQTLPPELLSDLWQAEMTALSIFPQRKDVETKLHWWYTNHAPNLPHNRYDQVYNTMFGSSTFHSCLPIQTYLRFWPWVLRTMYNM